jgi:hypothetical protein
MKKTRLFHTLVLVGASLTGGVVATTATVSVAMIAGCDDDTTMSGFYPDIGVPPIHDMAVPRDLSPVDLPAHDG